MALGLYRFFGGLHSLERGERRPCPFGREELAVAPESASPDKRGLIHENDISSLILRFAPVRCNKARIIINGARDVPQLSEIGFYKASEEEI